MKCRLYNSFIGIYLTVICICLYIFSEHNFYDKVIPGLAALNIKLV